MTDWRKAARKGEWDSINCHLLKSSELLALQEILTKIVPKRIFGHGLETIEEHIWAVHAKDKQEASAATLLESVRSYVEKPLEIVSKLTEAIQFAVEFFETNGLDYVGWQETYIYPKKAGNFLKSWGQVPTDIGFAIVEKRIRMDGFESDNSDLYISPLASDLLIPASKMTNRKWIELYAWRRCCSIAEAFYRNMFEPFSPEWHACNILHHASDLSILKNLELEVNKFELAIKYAMEVGISATSLGKKPLEMETLAARVIREKNRSNAPKGGEKMAARAAAARMEIRNIALSPESIRRWVGLSPREQLKFLRRQAIDFDRARSDDEKLFSGPRGNTYANRWFADCLSEWRANGDLKRAL